MKREAIIHSKMKRLCRRLNIPTWQGVGLMESIWHLTSRQCPRGDIGRLSDEDIALAIDYREDPAELVTVLVGCGWIDPDPEHRLLIHDWHEHADDALNMRLARARQFFASGQTPKLARLAGNERRDIEEWYAHEMEVRAHKTDLCAHGIPPNQSVRTACAPPSPAPPFSSPSSTSARTPPLPSPEPASRQAPPELLSTPETTEPERSKCEFEFRKAADDDEHQTPDEIWSSPQDEVKAIIRRKLRENDNDDMIPTTDWDWISEHIEAGGIDWSVFAKLLREQSNNSWKNPIGFVKAKVKTFRSSAAATPAPRTKAEVDEENYKCPTCYSRKRGEGIVLVNGEQRPCTCASAHYIERMTKKGIFGGRTRLQLAKGEGAA